MCSRFLLYTVEPEASLLFEARVIPGNCWSLYEISIAVINIPKSHLIIYQYVLCEIYDVQCSIMHAACHIMKP